MKLIKIRGHNRIHRKIDEWRSDNLHLDIAYLKERQRDYVKLNIHPFCDLTILNSTIPQPWRKTRKLICSALLDIYDSWKVQLDETGQPYYLKIWLFEERFSNSQIVCSVGDFVDFYDKTFYKAHVPETIRSSGFGTLKKRIEGYSWELHQDNDIYSNDEVGDRNLYKSDEDYNVSKLWFAKLLKRKHITEKMSGNYGNATESYLFYRGKVWIGEKI